MAQSPKSKALYSRIPHSAKEKHKHEERHRESQEDRSFPVYGALEQGLNPVLSHGSV